MLDGVRGVAAVAVLVYHGSQPVGINIVPFGWASVDLFFLLSGFVLTHAYGQRLRNGLTLGDFTRARLVRLYPLYGIGLLIGVFTLTGENLLPSAALGVCFVPYLTPHTVTIGGVATANMLYPLNGPSWSLFDEIIVNILFAIMAIRKINIVWMFTVGAFGFILFYTLGHDVLDGGWTSNTAESGVARALFSFPLGGMLYSLSKRFHAPLLSGWPVVIGVVALVAIPQSHDTDLIVSILLVALAFPAIIFLGSMATFGSRSGKFFAWLGAISYALYAVHVPVYMLLLPHLGAHSGLAAIAGGIVSIAAAHLLTTYVEPRVRKILNSLLSAAETPLASV